MSAEISRRIIAKVEAGMTIEAAIDAVLGQGSFAKIAEDIYNALRA